MLLEELAVLGQGEVGVEANLAGKPLLQRPPLARAGGPGIGSASTSSPVSRRFLSQRLTVAGETPKVPTISPRGRPRSTAAKTFNLRSFEYAFMTAVLHQLNAHVSRCSI